VARLLGNQGLLITLLINISKNTMLNQTYVSKENGLETIKVYNQQKNVYFELVMNTATKEVTHYRSLPINVKTSDIETTDLMQ
jgi:hypothetical protein